MDNITLNLSNLTEAERETLMTLVKKGNEPNSKIWKPKYGETYWVVDHCGKIHHFAWQNDTYDTDTYQFGNVFPTEEIAQEEAKRREILTKWLRLSVEAGEPDNLYCFQNEHWSIAYDMIKEQHHYINNKYNYGTITFPSVEALDKAIEEIGGMPIVIRYVLGVGLPNPYSYQGTREAREDNE